LIKQTTFTEPFPEKTDLAPNISYHLINTFFLRVEMAQEGGDDYGESSFLALPPRFEK